MFIIIFFAIAIPVCLLVYFKFIKSSVNKYDITSRGKILELQPYKNMHNYYLVRLEYEYEG